MENILHQLFGGLLSWVWLCLALGLLDLPLFLLLLLPESPRHLLRSIDANNSKLLNPSPRKGKKDAAVVVLKRLGRVAEAKKVAEQDSKNLPETKTLETLKTGCMFQICKQGSSEKEKQDSQQKEKKSGDPLDSKFSAEGPQTGQKSDAPEKSWTKEKSWKGEENLLPVSTPPALCTKLTLDVPGRQGGVGVHFASQNKVFAVSGLKEPKTSPLKDQSLWSTIQPGVWLEKLREGNLKEQLCGISKATTLIFLHEWGGSSVLLQHSILILIQGGTPEADVFNLNLILGGAILATSTAGGLLNSRGSASCRRALLLATTAVIVASLALLSLSLAFRCPGQQILDFSTTAFSNECVNGTFFCEAAQQCLMNSQTIYTTCDSPTSTTTTPSPQNSTMEFVTACENYNFPIELLLLAAILASQHLGLDVCIYLNLHCTASNHMFGVPEFSQIFPYSASGEVSGHQLCIFEQGNQQLVREVGNHFHGGWGGGGGS